MVIRGITKTQSKALENLEQIVKLVIENKTITKREAFKIHLCCTIAADFNTRQIVGETGEQIVGDYYGVVPEGGNTPHVDIVYNAKSVKTRTIEGDVDGIKPEALDVLQHIIVVIYEENDLTYKLYKATPEQYLSTTHRLRNNGYSVKCEDFVKVAEMIEHGSL